MPPVLSASRRKARLTAAGVTIAVAAVGFSVTGHGTAGAATTATWNRLADCESGGNWHINTGNGYYGGLQFSLSTWIAMGGRKYAPRPDLATAREQMDIGEVLLKANNYSWRAWPACSAKLGLTRADAKATDTMVNGVFVHPYEYTDQHRSREHQPLGRLVRN